MKTRILKALLLVLCISGTCPVLAQFNLKKAISGAAKTVQAATLTDEQMAEYVKEYIDWMDKHNQVCADDNPYTLRLKTLTEGLTDADGIPLNFKVYYVTDVNAFACADGSIRVFSSLMDIMTDEELLGVIARDRPHRAPRLEKRVPHGIAHLGTEGRHFIERRKGGGAYRIATGRLGRSAG